MRFLLARPSFPKVILIPLLFGLLGASASSAQETVSVTEISPHVLVFGTSTGNLVASVGADGALLIGTPSAASTASISAILASRTKSPVRYVVIAPEDPAKSQGDAAWSGRGAFVAMQENALRRLGGNVMGPPLPLPARFMELGVERPRIAFSEVLAFDINGEAIHVVHQKPGYSDADVIAHFHIARLVYLGEVFPGDGYPAIDLAQGGTLDGLLSTLGAWEDSSFQVVPARGPVTDGSSVKAFREMIVEIRDSIKRLRDAGKREDQIVAEHPTAKFDGRWGHGRVQPDQFVHEIYGALHHND